MSRTFKDIRSEYREQRQREIEDRTRAREAALFVQEISPDGWVNGLPVRREWTIDVPAPNRYEPERESESQPEGEPMPAWWPEVAPEEVPA